RNVALKQNTTQSGIYIDETYTAEYSNSSNAVDGKALYNFSEKSCAHPFSGNRNKQFWTVLFSPHVVTGYVLYDRQDNFANFKGFQLTASSGSKIQFKYTDVPKNGEREIYRIADYQKRIVTNVTIDRDNDLNVCEVEVYG
ncbi:multiple epidermal growth factor-like domains protein 11, partial [Biomphalaria glabrata]